MLTWVGIVSPCPKVIHSDGGPSSAILQASLQHFQRVAVFEHGMVVSERRRRCRHDKTRREPRGVSRHGVSLVPACWLVGLSVCRRCEPAHGGAARLSMDCSAPHSTAVSADSTRSAPGQHRSIRTSTAVSFFQPVSDHKKLGP